MSPAAVLVVVISCIFVVGLIIMARISDTIDQQENNITTAEKSLIYCVDGACGKLSYRRESHVHLKGILNFCSNESDSTAFSKIKKMEMWDNDNFLHFGDDFMGECEMQTNDHFDCHFIGRSLIEGSGYNNVPDVYFRFHLHQQFCPEGDTCQFSTRNYIIWPSCSDARDCQVNPALGTVVTDDDIVALLEPFPFYQEVDANWKWIVWKCYVEINLDPFGSQYCSSPETND